MTAEKKEANKTIVKPKVRIKLRAYDYKVLDKSARQIIETAIRYGADISGPVPLPTEIHKYTTNRSTFIHKDAREQFEIRVHKRLIDIYSPTQKLIEALTSITLPSGVDVQIKV